MILILRVYNDEIYKQNKVYRFFLKSSLHWDDDEFVKNYQIDKQKNNFSQIFFIDFLESICPPQKTDFQIYYLGSGTYGFAYKVQLAQQKNILEFCVKFCPYFKFSGEEMLIYDNNKRPENSEHLIIQLLYLIFFREIEKQQVPFFMVVCPQFTGVISYKEFQNFIERSEKKTKHQELQEYQESILNNFYEENISIQKRLQKLQKQKKIHCNLVKFLACEYCIFGNLQMFLQQQIKENWKRITQFDIYYIYFQVIYSLAIIHSYYPKFKHNDLKPNNILVQKTNQKQATFKFEGEVFQFDTNNYQLKLWDFDFSCIDGFIDNIKCQQEWANKYYVDQKENQFSDIYFFTRYFTQIFLPQFQYLFKQNQENQQLFEIIITIKIFENNICTREFLEQEKEKRIPSSLNKIKSGDFLKSNLFQKFKMKK